LIKDNETALISKSAINQAIHTHKVSGSNEKDYFARTEVAILNATELDEDPKLRILPNIGTRIYKLVTMLLKYA